MKSFFPLIVLLLFSLSVQAVQTTEGTEFWVTFLHNYGQKVGSEDMTLKLIASARQASTMTVTNPQTGWSVTANIAANEISELVIPHDQGYTYSDGAVEQRGLHVASTTPVSLYASNFVAHSYDATIVLPETGLGTDYVIQIFENTLTPREFGVVATEDATDVTITPRARTRDNKVKDVPFTVRLNAGESYQVMSADPGNDFSGSRVEATKPVAVFSGHNCINVPTGNPWCDHIVEQQTPVVLWGRQFAVTQTAGQHGDYVMVTASEPQTQVRINGSLAATLNAGESYTWRLTDRSAWVETSNAAACYLYLEGARDNDMTGDPSMVHITPVEQRTKELTFATFQTDESRTHYANVVTTATGAAAMMLDGHAVSEFFEPLTGNTSLRFAQLPIEHGTHTLATTADGFTGHVYGVGYCESYAYNMGQAVTPLTGLIVVNGQARSDIDYQDEYCYLQPVAFRPHTNINYLSVRWDFGDGSGSTEPEPTHRYATPGDYLVTMYVTGPDNNDTARTTLHLTDELHESLSVSLCQGESYTINGIPYSETGDYQQTLTSVGGCDSIVTLHVLVNDTSVRYDTITIHEGTSTSWYGHWYREAGNYRDTLQSKAGCDSVIQLTLLVIEPVQEMYDTICWRPTYTFMCYDYAIPPMDGMDETLYYSYTLEARDVVDCITYKMHLAVINQQDGRVIVLHDTIQQGQSYEFFGETLRREGTYTHVSNPACECSQTYILYLTVLSYPILQDTLTLCHEDTIIYRGKPYSTPGVYSDTVMSLAGIDAVYRLHLNDNRSFREFSIIITAGDPLPPPLGIITESGTYTYTLTNALGCDSIVTWYVGVNERCVVPKEEYHAVCAGDAYPWHGRTLSEEGDYTDSLWHSGSDDCDTVVTLHLSMLPIIARDTDIYICEGDYYPIGTERLSEQGTYSFTCRATNGCDSIVSVHLHYLPTYRDTTFAIIPFGDEYAWEGEVYSEPVTLTYGYVATNDCDSLTTLQLTVDYSLTVEQMELESGCSEDEQMTLHVQLSRLVDSVRITFSDEAKAAGLRDTIVYIHAKQADILLSRRGTQPGTFTYEVALVHDTAVLYTDTLNLSTLPVVSRDTDIYICEGAYYIIGTERLSEQGIYPVVFRADNGCDSIMLVRVNYLPTGKDTIFVTIPYGGEYIWEGDVYSEPTTQTRTHKDANDCDSLTTLQLTVDYSLTVEQMELESGCSEDEQMTLHLQLSRLVDSVRITYSDEAKAAGLRDSIVYFHAKEGDVFIPHQRAHPGRYTCDIALVHATAVLYTGSFTITLLYPASVLEQAWNDVVAVLTHDYNGGYDFVAFQWYENGEMLAGENGSYLYRPLIMGGEYSALLTDVDGRQSMTCPLIATRQEDISLYPTFIGSHQIIRCHVSQESELWLYDALGRLVGHSLLPAGDTHITAPGTTGVYIALIVTRTDQKEHPYKLIVQ